MSAWAAVLDDAARRGGTPDQVAARLGLPRSLVHAVLDHAGRLGLVVIAGRDCASGCPTGAAAPGCVGCPLAVSGPSGARTRE
ncbi:hypothetical protein [Pengzhenrongella sicca]|uniref:Transcriptional regulator HTH-type FeoC domain-containing protein n=1 Tax=Pengzhenrongella sicca TaxID=2819238 RepID=A0A8A4ZA34_9MICO|nr:hypothetical protein [Pengzhenrongella sicca]QTE27889.1 hypothetical protein J4E96_10720 [Pengzhenrongella sicca]